MLEADLPFGYVIEVNGEEWVYVEPGVFRPAEGDRGGEPDDSGPEGGGTGQR
jgi:hypothetical protein